MVELIVATYGLLCWLVFKKLKLVPVTTYTVCTAILGGVVILGLLFISLSIFHPVSHDGRMYAPVVQIVPQVRGTVIEVPVEANKPVKKGDVLFKIDPQPYKIEVDRLRASLETKNVKFYNLAEQLASAMPAHHRGFMQGLALTARFGDYFFCHAGIRPGVPLDRQSPHDLVWIRDEFLLSGADHGVVVVHGHTPAAAPELLPNRINIDTGAVFGGPLTCLVLEGTEYRFL